MTDLEYVRRLGIIYQEVLKLRKDSDYRVNQPQMDKFVKVLDFFMDEASAQGGTVEPVKLVPKEGCGDLTAMFLVFNLYGDKVLRFCDVMRNCSAIGIDTLADGRLCIACTVPDVYVHI